MKNPEFDPRAINHFFTIGAVLFEMKTKPNMKFHDEVIDVIDLEYDRIEFELTNIWKDKPIGLNYVLQSQCVEADRLFTMVVQEEERNEDREHESEDRASRAAIYTSMKVVLMESMILIDNLMDGNFINLEDLD